MASVKKNQRDFTLSTLCHLSSLHGLLPKMSYSCSVFVMQASFSREQDATILLVLPLPSVFQEKEVKENFTNREKINRNLAWEKKKGKRKKKKRKREIKKKKKGGKMAISFSRLLWALQRHRHGHKSSIFPLQKTLASHTKQD